MKPQFTALFALLFTQSAFAVTADQFKCKISFESKDPAIQSFETQAELTGLRLAVATPGTPDLPGVPDVGPPGFTIISESRVSTSTGISARKLLLSLNLSYQHAVKRNANDVIVEAKQRTCLSYGYSIDNNSFFTGCRGGEWAWINVEVRNGVPLFSTEELASIEHVTDQGRVTLGCTYASTYY